MFGIGQSTTLHDYDLFLESHTWGEIDLELYPKVNMRTSIATKGVPQRIADLLDTERELSILEVQIEYDLTASYEIIGKISYLFWDHEGIGIIQGNLEDWQEFMRSQFQAYQVDVQ